MLKLPFGYSNPVCLHHTERMQSVGTGLFVHVGCFDALVTVCPWAIPQTGTQQASLLTGSRKQWI